MITLFIDTSLTDVSIAVLKNTKVLSSINKNIPGKHSIYVIPFINECLIKANLTPDEIDQIMVVTGPGSFTGLRIGVTIAKTYAYLRKIPIIAVSSLKMIALSKEINNNYILSLIDAKHDNYYLGLYTTNYQEEINEHFASKEEVIAIIKKYNPSIVSNDNLNIDNINILRQELNISKIVSYYMDKKKESYFTLLPNYLKLPQVLEDKHD